MLSFTEEKTRLKWWKRDSKWFGTQAGTQQLHYSICIFPCGSPQPPMASIGTGPATQLRKGQAAWFFISPFYVLERSVHLHLWVGFVATNSVLEPERQHLGTLSDSFSAALPCPVGPPALWGSSVTKKWLSLVEGGERFPETGPSRSEAALRGHHLHLIILFDSAGQAFPAPWIQGLSRWGPEWWWGLEGG